MIVQFKANLKQQILDSIQITVEGVYSSPQNIETYDFLQSFKCLKIRFIRSDRVNEDAR